MKKFKLIKDYPKCPINIGDTVVYCKNDSTYAHYYENKAEVFSKSSIEDYPEFWEEVIEINYDELLKEANKKYPKGTKFAPTMSKGNYYSTSSGKFIVNGSFISDLESYKPVYNINQKKWADIQEPLFTTEDGVDVYNDCYLWCVSRNKWTNNKYFLNVTNYFNQNSLNEQLKGHYIFYKFENAEKYIEENEPKYSISNIKKAINDAVMCGKNEFQAVLFENLWKERK